MSQNAKVTSRRVSNFNFFWGSLPQTPKQGLLANLATYSVQMIHLLHFPMITLKVANFCGYVINFLLQTDPQVDPHWSGTVLRGT